MQQNNQIQANVEEIINDLTQQISQLTYDGSVLRSLVNQYQKRVDELERQLEVKGDEELE